MKTDGKMVETGSRSTGGRLRRERAPLGRYAAPHCCAQPTSMSRHIKLLT